jgi:outer membrane beta-barrel protein
MKRPAIFLFVWVAVAGWAAGGQAWAKKGGRAAPAPAPTADTPTTDSNAPAADQNAAPADTGQAAPAAGEAAPGTESLETEEGKATKVEGEDAEPVIKSKAATTLSWQDIVVVPRKAFLKGGRFELSPFTGVSINDVLIRHYVFGVDLNFFLTDVLWVGLQGQYFIKELTERQDLVGLQFNRITTLNRYLYGGALNFGYVPVYGKFAWFNKSIIHWEIYASAGVGVTESETIPRNPGASPFKNTLITPNVGIGSRFFLFDWLTINVALRDYIMADKFEAVPNLTPNDAAASKAAAESALVNNVMLYAGVGFYLPTKFQYKSPR